MIGKERESENEVKGDKAKWWIWGKEATTIPEIEENIKRWGGYREKGKKPVYCEKKELQM